MSSDTTIDLIRRALDASLMRQTAIAQNIANSNTSDYQSIEVNFEQQLQETSATERTTAQPFYQPCTQHSSIDEQMALNVQNMTHYRALIKGLNQKLAIMKLALQGSNQ